MKFSIVHNKQTIEINIDDAKWSLRTVKEAISEETGIPVKELSIKVAGIEVTTNKSLPSNPGTIDFFNRRILKTDFIDSSASISNIVPTDILKDIFSRSLMSIDDYVTVAKLNKYLNSVTTNKIFKILDNPQNREIINKNLKEKEQKTMGQLTGWENRKNRKYDHSVGYFKKSAIKSRFKKATTMPIDFISTLSYADGKRAHAAVARFDEDSIKSLYDFLFKKHCDLESYVQTYGLFGLRFAEIMIREHELSILNDSSIIKDNPVVINSTHIQEVVSKKTAWLLGYEMSEAPSVEFIKDHWNLKMVLRFKEAKDATEVMYALQKEPYNFPYWRQSYSDNLFDKFDIYPCENIDYTTNEPHRFIAASSIALFGIQDVCSYIFDACQSDKQPVKDFMDIISKLKLDVKDVKYGFISAFNKFIDNKIKEFQGKQERTGLSHLFQNNGAISVKLEFLNEIKNQIVDVYSDPYNILDKVFKSTDISKIDKHTLANYQRFKDIFYEIYTYLEPQVDMIFLSSKT